MNDMNQGILPIDFYEITKRLMPGQEELPRTEAMADHPDWCYETFIECFRTDMVDEMTDRAKFCMGYREFEEWIEEKDE